MSGRRLLSAAFLLTIFLSGLAGVSEARPRRKTATRVTTARKLAAKKTKRQVYQVASPFDRYRGATPTGEQLFGDRAVANALIPVMKKDYGKLVQNLIQVDGSQPVVDASGALVVSGGVPFLETMAAGMFIIDPKGRVYAAIQEGGEKVHYFTNDPAFKRRPPASIERWRSRFPDAKLILRSK